MLMPEVKDNISSKRFDVWKLWSMKSVNGRQNWIFNLNGAKDKFFDNHNDFISELKEAFKFNKKENPNSSDLVYRGQCISDEFQTEIPSWLKESSNFSNSRSKKANVASYKGIHFYKQLQAEDGHWPGDYGGPLFLLPALVMASHITKTSFDEVQSELMKVYMLNHQNDDSGWGLHIEGESTMFGTVMQYCALRILGADAEDENILQAQRWIQKNGGAGSIPSWGKFFLSMLGVYDWKGCHSLMPEMWLLPKWLPIHPWRYWCHARMVYLPMSYCYGHRIAGEQDELIHSIRSEIYSEPYETINWPKQRNKVCAADRFSKTSRVSKLLLGLLDQYENFVVSFLRKRSLKFVLNYIDAEDEQTSYVDIGPVNQIINSICTWHAYGAKSDQFRQHVERWQDYLWLAEDGLKMNGYNGSQLWDTAFATQAITEHQADLIDHETIVKAYSYINYSQIKEEVNNREKFFRHQSVGGWPFSTLEHGWPISDCTAEGLKAVLKVHASEFAEDIVNQKIPPLRLEQAVDLILSFQNKDGGWATYENTRSGSALEFLNPSEVFGKIMVDYSWVECTSACITALCDFQKSDSNYRKQNIDQAIGRGIDFILGQQNPDGSWIGSWGVCFTYGTWFGIEALTAIGETTGSSQALKKACSFLIGKQNNDGGWGESHQSCVKSVYSPHDQSQVVNSSWALLSLMAAKYENIKPIERGIDFLIESQQKIGDWPQESISGVFNQNCMITYTAYRNVFPIWALGRYLKRYDARLNYRGNY